MMGSHEDPTITDPNLYPAELQIKLYQAFIFSIPILFSIILFLLFYLFYLKRRATNIASLHPRTHISATNLHSVSFISSPWNLGIKGDLKDKLQIVQFDDQLKAKDSICCVCLGEFEMEEELRQLPLCKHVFHGDCIRHWLRANATCPLCRCPLICAIKMGHPITTTHQTNNVSAQLEGQESRTETNSVVQNSLRSEEHVIHISEDSSSTSNRTSL